MVFLQLPAEVADAGSTAVQLGGTETLHLFTQNSLFAVRSTRALIWESPSPQQLPGVLGAHFLGHCSPPSADFCVFIHSYININANVGVIQGM